MLKLLDHTWRDLRHAVRSIAKMPLVATVVVVSLGIGIGVNTAVFSWIQAVVLRPLPGVPDPRGFYFLEPRAESGSYPGVSWLEYQDFRESLRSFKDLFAFRMVPLNVGDGGQRERTYALLVSGNYFRAVGVTPAAGRLLQPDEVSKPGGEPVVVLSHRFWMARFNGDPGALGRTIRVNDRTLTVVGVVSPGFQGTVLGLQFDLWVPATMAPELLGGSTELQDRRARGYSVLGRLRSDASRASAQAEADAAMTRMAADYPETDRTVRADVLPFWWPPRGPQRMLAGALAILQGLMLLLLLAVCGNAANLMLARSSTRQREMGVRAALGAGPWQIVALLFAENLVLAVLASIVGAFVAAWGTDALRAVPLSTSLPIRFQTSVDPAGVAFALSLGIGCALMFGIAPAAQFARVDPQLALRSGADTAARSRLRHALMGIEVALAVAVLLAAGLFFRSVTSTRGGDPGFRREGVLLAAYDFTGRNIDDAAAREFASRVLEELRALPNVEQAAISSNVPLDIHGLPLRNFFIDGHVRADGRPDQALSNVVTPGYFAAMGIALREGTDFAALTDVEAVPQAIVNEEFVRRFVANGRSLGRSIRNGSRTYLIAGVVRNSTYESFGEAPLPIVYLSYRDRPSRVGQIHVRTRPGAETLLGPDIRRVVRDIDPALPLYDMRTLTEHVETNLFLRRIPARMFVVLGPLLLALAAIGIYAVVAYAVSRRTTEIGIRLALGATARRVVRDIVGESLEPILSGAFAGWLAAFLVAIHLVPGGTIDVLVFAGVPAVLLAVAALACWLPAQRATRIDPVAALRHD